MTKIRAKIEIKQDEYNDRYVISIHSPKLQSMIREIATSSKYISNGYIHENPDIRLNEFKSLETRLILPNGKPNLIPLFLKSSKYNKYNIYFSDVKPNEIESYSRQINTHLVTFYNFLSNNKHKFNREWLIKALDYYLECGMYENKITYANYSYNDLVSYLHSLESRIDELGIKPYE